MPQMPESQNRTMKVPTSSHLRRPDCPCGKSTLRFHEAREGLQKVAGGVHEFGGGATVKPISFGWATMLLAGKTPEFTVDGAKWEPTGDINQGPHKTVRFVDQRLHCYACGSRPCD
jgi:hypothetical protein